ncbi:MAG: hypothetical protein SFX72_03655 [Isosphaeraceae bacterium]|nr:hypothetical protein [Isosphaeraceae bacterium]
MFVERPVTTAPTVDPAWQAREITWRRKLRRLRFNAEPLAEQVEKYRRATVVLTVVPALIAVFFVAIFAAFGRPDIGLIGVAVLFIPMLAWAWADFLTLRRRYRAYERERIAAQGLTSSDPASH